MKKILLILMMAVALTLAACEGVQISQAPSSEGATPEIGVPETTLPQGTGDPIELPMKPA